ncbi:hypothetical protein [Kutzneria kofuensis]|uniref:Uncharacterized protein n=1 Tax=Kutzneria kofuensis TaxID=103725 RepID=A0A7W9KSP0_9PSEU|nr:hypothetical protein [Kutzneria kofuensis]MBB5898021.1 hypothetical protein [Kutzneria kofuensis]
MGGTASAQRIDELFQLPARGVLGFRQQFLSGQPQLGQPGLFEVAGGEPALDLVEHKVAVLAHAKRHERARRRGGSSAAT